MHGVFYAAFPVTQNQNGAYLWNEYPLVVFLLYPLHLVPMPVNVYIYTESCLAHQYASSWNGKRHHLYVFINICSTNTWLHHWNSLLVYVLMRICSVILSFSFFVLDFSLSLCFLFSLELLSPFLFVWFRMLTPFMLTSWSHNQCHINIACVLPPYKSKS